MSAKRIGSAPGCFGVAVEAISDAMVCVHVYSMIWALGICGYLFEATGSGAWHRRGKSGSCAINIKLFLSLQLAAHPVSTIRCPTAALQTGPSSIGFLGGLSDSTAIGKGSVIDQSTRGWQLGTLSSGFRTP